MLLSMLSSTTSRPIGVLQTLPSLPFSQLLTHVPPPPPPPPPVPPLMYRLIGADPATWSPKNAEFNLEDVSMEELITNHTLIGSNPATWTPKSKNNNCLEHVCNKDIHSNDVIVNENATVLTTITPINNSINDTQVELYMQDINFADVINFDTVVLLQYIKDVINSAVDFGNSNNLTDLLILVVRDIEDYKNTYVLNTNIYNDYKLLDYNLFDYKLNNV